MIHSRCSCFSAKCAAVVGIALTASFALGASAVLAPLRAQVALAGIPRLEAGGGLDFAAPVGDFRANVRQGFGGGGHFLVGIDPDAVISLRVDAGFINYGNETHYIPFSASARRIIVQEKTSNNIFLASVGPQITFPIGRVRPYVNAGVGFAYFFTQTSLNTDDESYQIAQTTNYSDNSLLYTGGAGFNVPLSFAGDYVSMDIGARYNSINSASYLTKGDIADDPNSQYGIIITPRQSAANFIAYHLGVSFRF
ncbi:MAG: outer membrane beta-barrel protein [Gemmatimonadaceae bacterium]